MEPSAINPALSPAAAVEIPARERILSTAYLLFARRGIRDVGVDELIRTSEVAKATFYHHFASKDDLVLAFLGRREELWSKGLFAAQSCLTGSPEEQLLVIFDVLGRWFQRDDFEGCSFVRVLMEVGPDHLLGRASIECLDRVRVQLCSMAEAASLSNADGVARSLMTIIHGSILSALEGDGSAAVRGRQLAGWVVEQSRRAA